MMTLSQNAEPIDEFKTEGFNLNLIIVGNGAAGKRSWRSVRRFKQVRLPMGGYLNEDTR